MKLRRKQTSKAQAVIDGVADAVKPREIADQASEAAVRVAKEVAKTSADLGSQVGGGMSEVAHALSEEGHAFMDRHAKKAKVKKPRRHRLRKLVLLSGAGAAAAYFLDPKAGPERRAAALRRTSTSAQVVGDGLDRAARVAHQTAEATSVDSEAAAPMMSGAEAPLI